MKRNETVTCRNILNMIFLDPFQIEKASKTGCHILIMVDANLCTNKWDDAKFLYKIILREVLEQSGITVRNVGNTYMADHMQKNGYIAESAIDHVYSSHSITNSTTIKTLNKGSSDLVPVIVELKLKSKKEIHIFVDRGGVDLNDDLQG